MRRESCAGCGLRRTLLRIGPPGARHYVCGECWHTIGRWACELVADHCGCLRCGECEQLREQCEECRPF